MGKFPLWAKALLLYIAAVLIVGAFLFIPAGTFDYWQGWLYLAILFIPVAFVGIYFLKKDPAFIERRFRTKEKEARQRAILNAALVFFIIGFLIPGLDRRFGWSGVPLDASILAAILCLIGYAIVFLAFRENSYAGRTVQVDKGQKVVSTGPYSIVRHPMYVGVLLLYNATPIALGSYWALPFFLTTIPVIVFRILGEEELLRKELPGYKAYCKKTKYRLLPHVW